MKYCADKGLSIEAKIRFKIKKLLTLKLKIQGKTTTWSKRGILPNFNAHLKYLMQVLQVSVFDMLLAWL